MENWDMFDWQWYRISRTGRVDAWGGKQYQRVRNAWVAAGKPDFVTEFILQNA